jgi:hypothetical protein
MVSDLKRILGYSSSQFTNNKLSVSTNELPSYNVAAEKQQREDMWSSNFNKYQSEYNKLLERPEVPVRVLPSEQISDKIQNMEELLKEHTRMREMDIEIISSSRSPPSSTSPSSKSSTYHEIGTPFMQNNTAINTNKNTNRMITPRLKIMDEIENSVDVERIEMDIHESNGYPKKVVHWLSEASSVAKRSETSSVAKRSETSSVAKRSETTGSDASSEATYKSESSITDLINEANEFSSNQH